MKPLYLLSFVMFLLCTSARADDIDNVAQFIKQGDAQKLSELMAPTLEFAINDVENDTATKKEATDALVQFFNQHKPVSVQTLHKVTSGKKFLFGVVICTTGNGVFRIAFALDISGGKSALIDLHIEPEKTK